MSGGEELELGANRLTNRQLFWVAVARFEFIKEQIENLYGKNTFWNNFHNYISAKKGFGEAFDCKK